MVADGPNKIFIGGLHYHLTDDQVMELLGAFGTIRSFHLVKADPTAMTSKGYCFVEYSDSSVTPIAVMGLNGMDMGGGKTLSARIAAGRSDMPDSFLPGTTASSNYGPPTTSAAEPTVVDGVDIQALLDAAMGGSGSMTMMPAAVAPAAAPVAAPMDPMAMYQNPGIPVMAHNPYAAPPSSLDPNAIATAALDAAFGGSAPPVHNGNNNNSAKPILTRILVLHNMVEEDDLTNDESYEELYDEVKEESAKFGKLTSMKIPRLSVSLTLYESQSLPF
jgi:splicing factor U2AF subunit